MSKLIKIDTHKFTKEELIVIETELFARLYDELFAFYKNKHIDQFNMMRFSLDMDATMLEKNFLRFIINDILESSEYSLEGIACYTQTPEDVICDILAGINNNPSLFLSKKIIDLHRSIRPTYYQETMQKILLASPSN